jgi:DnaK suppressor protein
VSSPIADEVKPQLEQDRERLRSEIADLGEATKATTYLEDETDAYDQHIADDASVLTDRTIDMSLRQNLEYELSFVDEALKRIADGSYGTCEICGKPIKEARLRARPAAVTCIECQSELEEKQRREGALALQ